MVEVFKTTVSDAYYAQLLVRKIHHCFPQYRANFDLTDCDRILRIQTNADIDIPSIRYIIQSFGYKAEVLDDEVIGTSTLTHR